MNAAVSPVILEARCLQKQYPGTTALKGIDYSVYRGQINVLIGENGAGKSTLMRILAGVEAADRGRLFLEGEEIRLSSPRDAARHGIALVHQELAILPNMDVSENIFAGHELTIGRSIVDRASQEATSQSVLQRLRKRFAISRPAAQLSLGNRQMVEIARALSNKARILILDEPTSALSSAETETLFGVLAGLKAEGVTIIYISHRLHELLHLGDHFTVLRSGRIVGQAERADVTREWIVERMSGQAARIEPMERTSRDGRSAILQVNDLTSSPASDEQDLISSLNGVSFELHSGEILGIYGLLGAGRTELLEILAGRRQYVGGEVLLGGRRIKFLSVAEAIKHGVVLVPEDRQRDGIVPEMSVLENILLSGRSASFLSKAQEMSTANAMVKSLNIAVNDINLPVVALSGGNQQKVLLARCLVCSPKILLLDEPSRGVDVGARAEIYRILQRLTDEGLSIIFTSSEVEETRFLADRALALCQGRITAELRKDEITDQSLFTAASPHVPGENVVGARHE